MNRMIALLAGLMLMIGTAATANALSLKVSTDGTIWQTITDNQIGDTDTTAGSISYTDLGLSGFTKVKVAGASENTLAGGSLYTNAFEVSGSASTLYLMLSDSLYNLSLPAVGGASSLTGLTMQNSGTTANLKTYFGSALFDTANQIADVSLSVPGFIGQTTSLPTLENPFSLTQFITINNLSGVASQITASLEVTPVPEPGTMLLLGSGLLGLAIYAKRRRNMSSDVSFG